MAKYIFPILLTASYLSLLSGCVTQSFENNEPIVKNQANRDEMAATRVSLGLGYLGMGNMSQAKFNLEKAKSFSPDLVQVHTAFAHYYETVGEAKLAVESFEKALSIQADSADTLNNYGVFLCRQGNIAAAEEQFLKAIAVPTYLLVAQSYENLASCYLQNDNFEKTEMYLDKAISHNPNRTVTLLQMVRLQYAMADYKEAKLFLQRFERNTQRFTASSLALSYKLNWKLGKRRTASNYANMLVKMYPQSWEGKQYLLNELELIDADNLAIKYQLSQKEKNKHLPSSRNKRVVKLSPKKSVNSPYTSSVAALSSPKLTVKSIAATNSASYTTKLPSVVVSTNQKTASKDISTDISTGSSLLSATAAETVVANATAAGMTIGVANATDTTNRMTSEKTVETVVVTTKSVEQVNQSDANVIGANSTQPIAATRDVPLPEALPESIEAVVPEKVDDSEEIEVEDVWHTVKSGENLYSISMKYNVKLSALHKWNNLSEKNKIRIGKKLYVVDPQTVNKIND